MTDHTAVETKRRAFVRELQHLHHNLHSGNPRRAGDARRDLARLRRSAAGQREEAQAYDIIFRHDPPKDEELQWLLVGGLFALHPQATDVGGRSIGWAMGLLAMKRTAAQRRFTQLVSVDAPALPHYLRQVVRLLRADEIPLDYHRLLRDLVTIERSGPQRAYRVRLDWARDYHHAQREQGRAPNAPAPADDLSASINA